MDLRQYRNFKRFRRTGFEINSQWELFNGFKIYPSFTLNSIEDRTLGESVKGGGRPKRRFNLLFEYKNKYGFMLYLYTYYVYWNEPASSNPNDKKPIFDLRLKKRFKKFSLFLNAFNLTNSKYRRDYYFPIPERYFEGGFSVRW